MEDAAAAASRAAITTNFARRAAMRILPQFLNLVADANANASAISQLLSSVGQPDAAAAAHGRAVLVGLEADRADAVGGELLVAVLGVAGHSDRADDLARGIANLQTAALGKNLFVCRSDEIAHEDRLLLGAHLHELGGAPHGERGIGFAVGHLEPDHGAAVLLLERLHLASGLDHDHRELPAIELGAAREDGVDEAGGLGEGGGGGGAPRCLGRWGGGPDTAARVAVRAWVAREW